MLKERYERLETGIHVELTEPDPEGYRIIAENMKHCYLYIPTGELYVARQECDIFDFRLVRLLDNTCIEEWEEVPLPSLKTINDMRLSNVLC